MFWKRKKIYTLDSTESTQLSNVESTICQAKYANLDLRRAVLDWRDQHIETVELHLARELTCLYSALDKQSDKMSVRDLFKQKRFGKEHFEPIYKDWVEREVTHLVTAAQKDLSAVFTHALEFGEQEAALNHEVGSAHYTDAAIAAAATGVGLAAIPAVAAISAVSAGGIMGFLGLSAISWPVVAIGVASIGALLALGGYKAAGLKSRAISRYRKSIRKVIDEQVLGYDSEKDSIRQRLQSYIDNTAKKIIMEIDQC